MPREEVFRNPNSNASCGVDRAGSTRGASLGSPIAHGICRLILPLKGARTPSGLRQKQKNVRWLPKRGGRKV